MEQWIGSVHSKMAWRTHFFFIWRLSRFGKELFKYTTRKMLGTIHSFFFLKEDAYVHRSWIYLEEEDFLFVLYKIIQNITSSEICALHLTHPSAHIPGAVGRQCCGSQGAVASSVPCSKVSPQSWYWRWRERSLFTPPTDNSCRSWDSNPQPRVTSPTLYPLCHDCLHLSNIEILLYFKRTFLLLSFKLR